jgi:hypothetical protein
MSCTCMCCTYELYVRHYIYEGSMFFPPKSECLSVAYRGGGLGWFNPPSPKFRSFDKAEPNSQFRGKYIHNNLIKIRVSLIYKLSGTPD